MNSNSKLTYPKSSEPHEKHSTSILQLINKFVFCNLFARISSPKIASINIKDVSDSKAIASILHIIINTECCSNKYIIDTILNLHPKIIKNIINIVNCSSSELILNLEIANNKVLSILGLKQNIELIPEYHDSALDPIKSQIQLICALYNNTYNELKEIYISSPFARQYFTNLCNRYKLGKCTVKCKVTIFPEELAGNNIVNLLKIITQCKDNNDIIEKVRDYAKEGTINITQKELAATFTTLAVYQLANINNKTLKECKKIANTIPLAMANASTDNCDGPNKDILSRSETIKVPNHKYTKEEDTKLKTDQHINKVDVNAATDDSNKVYLSDLDNVASGSNTLQVPVIKIAGHSNLAFDHHLDEY